MNVQEWLSAEMQVDQAEKEELSVLLTPGDEYWKSLFYKEAFDAEQELARAKMMVGGAGALTYKMAMVADVIMRIGKLGLPEELQKMIKKMKG